MLWAGPLLTLLLLKACGTLVDVSTYLVTLTLPLLGCKGKSLEKLLWELQKESGADGPAATLRLPALPDRGTSRERDLWELHKESAAPGSGESLGTEHTEATGGRLQLRGRVGLGARAC